jgi:hypothetical protein
VTIYLDNCCLNRPYDAQAAAGVRLETEVIELILNAVVEARISLLWSDTLDTENEQNPFEERRTGIARWKNSAAAMIQDAPAIRDRARVLTADGFKALDALHLASATAGGASHFLTVNDRILNKRERVREIVSSRPWNLCNLLEDNYED